MSKYSLSLDETNRILSATFPKYNPTGLMVDELPEGDIYDYIVKISKKGAVTYIYEPLPKEDAE